jgi:penicillin-binding protein 1C
VITGRLRSGGSTLTMQLARRLQPRPRTFQAKVIEAIRAVQLEIRLSKREILAAYLTLAPYGGPLEGVRAASLAYFGHEPSTLTDSEQALLIALPQAPEARRPDRRYGAALRSRATVLRRLAKRKLLTAEAAREAAAEPVPRRRPFPTTAFTAAGELARAAPAGQATVNSTLDVTLQRRLEGFAALAADGQGASTSVAILVVETRTRAVRAAITSAGRNRPGGWVDATRALRSPGSALKPFIYALAFEQGIAAPETQIADSPVAFADYQPEDFDRVFHGPVTARQALQYSLNVPAVTLLSKVGPGAFDSRLQNAGVALVRPKQAMTGAGLPLALGGAGMTLRDLAVLYAALADGGVAKPLAWTKDEAEASPRLPGRRLVRADAAEKVLAILRDSPPPADRPPPALSLGAPPLAFKTGTSYGFRDALAAGVGDGYVVVVWTGRPDGGARLGMSGRAAALPLLFQSFDALQGQSSAPRPSPPRRPPHALTALDEGRSGPRMIFPPDGARVIVDAFGPRGRGLALAATGDKLRWYVDGAPITPDPGGRPVWRPDAPGFYRVTAVDGQGARSEVRVRVASN